MKMQIDGYFEDDKFVGRIEVRLSESNLRSLLYKLQRPDSRKTIYKHFDGSNILFVVADSDDKHYNTEQRGLMHPAEETLLRDPGFA